MINITQPISYNSPKFELSRQYYATLEALNAEDADLFPNYYITNVAGTLYQLKNGTWSKYTFDLGDLIKENTIIGNTGSDITYQDYAIYIGTDASNALSLSQYGLAIVNDNTQCHLESASLNLTGLSSQIRIIAGTDPYLKISAKQTTNTGLKITENSITYTGNNATMSIGFADEESEVGQSKVFATDGSIVDLYPVLAVYNQCFLNTGGTITGQTTINNSLYVKDSINCDNIVANKSLSIEGVSGIKAIESNRSSNKVFATDGSIVDLPTTSTTSTNYLSLTNGGTVTGSTIFSGSFQLGTTNIITYNNGSLILKNAIASTGIALTENNQQTLSVARNGENSANYIDSPLMQFSSSLATKFLAITNDNYKSAEKVFATDGSIKDLTSYIQVQKQIKALINRATNNSIPFESTLESEKAQFTNTWITNPGVAEDMQLSAYADGLDNKVLYLQLPALKYLEYYQLNNIQVYVYIQHNGSTIKVFLDDLSQSLIDQINSFDYTEYNKPLNITTVLSEIESLDEGDTITAEITFTFADFTIDTIKTKTYARRLIWACCGSIDNQDNEQYPIENSPTEYLINHLMPTQSNVKTVIWDAVEGQYAYVTVPSEWNLPTNGEIQSYTTDTKYGCVKVGDFTLSGSDALKSREYTTYRSTKVLDTSEKIKITFA